MPDSDLTTFQDKYFKIKKRIFTIIQVGSNEDFPSRGFDYLVMIAILINLFIAIFSTFALSKKFTDSLYVIETITVIFFTFEYILRLWTANYLYPRYGRVLATLRYMISLAGIVGLISFLPFYLPFFFPDGLVTFRMFRVVRILRLFRITRYYDALNLITDVLKKKKDQLLSSVFIVLVLMISSSLVMYGLEHDAQPEVFSNAFSGFWWATATLFTIGYGDIYPITLAGRITGIIITFLGVGMVAIPTGILSAGFVEQVSELQTKKDKKTYCPHCGKKL